MRRSRDCFVLWNAASRRGWAPPPFTPASQGPPRKPKAGAAAPNASGPTAQFSQTCSASAVGAAAPQTRFETLAVYRRGVKGGGAHPRREAALQIRQNKARGACAEEFKESVSKERPRFTP